MSAADAITYEFSRGDMGPDASEDDADAYAQAVADAIVELYPDADVTVEWRGCLRSRVRADGDDAIATIREIAARVWDDGEFWPEPEAS